MAEYVVSRESGKEKVCKDTVFNPRRQGCNH